MREGNIKVHPLEVLFGRTSGTYYMLVEDNCIETQYCVRFMRCFRYCDSKSAIDRGGMSTRIDPCLF